MPRLSTRKHIVQGDILNMTSLATSGSPRNPQDLLEGTASRGNEDGEWLLEWFPGFDIPIGLEGRAYLRRLLNHRRAEDPAACEALLSAHGIKLGRGVPGHTSNWGSMKVKELLHAAYLLGCWSAVERLCINFCQANGLKTEWIRELKAKGGRQSVTLANLQNYRKRFRDSEKRKTQVSSESGCTITAQNEEDVGSVRGSTVSHSLPEEMQQPSLAHGQGAEGLSGPAGSLPAPYTMTPRFAGVAAVGGAAEADRPEHFNCTEPTSFQKTPPGSASPAPSTFRMPEYESLAGRRRPKKRGSRAKTGPAARRRKTTQPAAPPEMAVASLPEEQPSIKAEEVVQPLYLPVSADVPICTNESQVSHIISAPPPADEVFLQWQQIPIPPPVLPAPPRVTAANPLPYPGPAPKVGPLTLSIPTSEEPPMTASPDTPSGSRPASESSDPWRSSDSSRSESLSQGSYTSSTTRTTSTSSEEDTSPCSVERPILRSSRRLARIVNFAGKKPRFCQVDRCAPDVFAGPGLNVAGLHQAPPTAHSPMETSHPWVSPEIKLSNAYPGTPRAAGGGPINSHESSTGAVFASSLAQTWAVNSYGPSCTPGWSQGQQVSQPPLMQRSLPPPLTLAFNGTPVDTYQQTSLPPIQPWSGDNALYQDPYGPPEAMIAPGPKCSSRVQTGPGSSPAQFPSCEHTFADICPLPLGEKIAGPSTLGIWATPNPFSGEFTSLSYTEGAVGRASEFATQAGSSSSPGQGKNAGSSVFSADVQGSWDDSVLSLNKAPECPGHPAFLPATASDQALISSGTCHVSGRLGTSGAVHLGNLGIEKSWIGQAPMAGASQFSSVTCTPKQDGPLVLQSVSAAQLAPGVTATVSHMEGHSATGELPSADSVPPPSLLTEVSNEQRNNFSTAQLANSSPSRPAATLADGSEAIPVCPSVQYATPKQNMAPVSLPCSGSGPLAELPKFSQKDTLVPATVDSLASSAEGRHEEPAYQSDLGYREKPTSLPLTVASPLS
ncbi:hypothetical protein CSUI_002504 [Cystoisospora suis]|uniref:Uncharacterized protein n=1 Tax=Cystoisospora suis TaxID=483139 RepID=A0A2C6L966_9APIC|nr:hypothetical protein CSUI_002504 [Cystoisospora suis]